MRVFIPGFDPSRIGGGWTWSRNIAKGLGDEFTTNYADATHYLIAGPTMVERVDVERAKHEGKKIILRCDNAVRNSRNRGTGMTRMKDFAIWADKVIYQSEWARKFLMPYLGVDGDVILNGVDTSMFHDKNRNAPGDSYLYIRSSRDEGKQWIMAWYWFVNNPGKLEIVGKFSTENMEYGFDFFNKERFIYTGENQSMPDVYRRNKYFLYTYLNDACSNTLLEARASGCEIVDVFGMLETGGAKEIMECEDISLERMVKEYRSVLNL